MDPRRHLQTTLDYDRWATQKWEDALDACPFRDRAREVLDHIADAQAAWIDRLGNGLGLPALAAGDSHARLSSMLLDQPLDQRFEWVRKRTGETRTSKVIDVYTHLPLHGTYHRGHLRGLAQAEGWAGFPETDAVAFPNWPLAEAGAEGLDLMSRRFAHDAWGWRLWAESIPSGPLATEFERVFAHHAGCPAGWGSAAAEALEVEGPSGDRKDPAGALAGAVAWWPRFLEAHGLDALYTWERPVKGDVSFPLEQLAFHVTNHGAYHRGHLRGLAEAAGWDGFPDTDYVFFTP